MALLRSAAVGTLGILSVALCIASWRSLRDSLCAGEQLMGDPGTALLINDASFTAYLVAMASMTLALGLVASRLQSKSRWVVLGSSVPASLIAFLVIASAGAESWYACAH